MGLLESWRQKRQIAALERKLTIKKSEAKLNRLQAQEHWSAYIGALVDQGVGFEDRYYIDVGFDGHDPLDHVELAEMRRVARDLEWSNGFAKAFGKNMQNFVVGRSGMTTSFKAPQDPPPEYAGISDEQWNDIVKSAKEAMDDFSRRNKWHVLQREAVKNAHRDGDWFLRDFVVEDGDTVVRMIDPDRVKSDSANKYPDGIVTDEMDEQLVVAYLVDGEMVPADVITHVKMGTDSDVLRGVPTLWSAREALIRGHKILRNMGKITEVQAAIAAVRTHDAPVGKDDMENFLDAAADKMTRTDIDTGNLIRQSKFHYGAVLDLQSGDNMHFPVGSAALTHFVAAEDAVLRGIAAEVIFPEFMFSANASNNNFASILEAGAPATKNFEAQQGIFEVPFRDIAQKVIRNKVLFGKLEPAALALEIVVTGPQVDIRDRLKGAERREIERRNGVLSIQTWTAERGDLDYETEQQNILEHEDRFGTGEPLPTPQEEPQPDVEPEQVPPSPTTQR